MKKENVENILLARGSFFSKLAKHEEENENKKYRNVQIFVSTFI